MAEGRVYKQGDLQPKLQADLNVDLTLATGVLGKWRRKHTTTVVSKTMAFADQAAGIVEYQWVTGDTDVAGTYLMECLVTWTGGTVQRFPQAYYNEFIIKERVGT